jgi:methionyl-tRNA formyltransferase
MVTPLRIVYFGTPAFAVPTLEALLASRHQVVGVVTQPDRPRGRGQAVTASPVKEAAIRAGVPVLQPTALRSEETLDAVRALGADLGVVAAYGRLLPQALLDVPRLGLINVHASLLPRWRGAAPIHRAIIAGDATTGVTIMRVVLALDAGPMLARVETPIEAEETSATLEPRLADLGGRLLVEVADRLADGPVDEVPQDAQAVTYAAKLDRAESTVDWSQSAVTVARLVRGLQPWPLVVITVGGRRLALLAATAEVATTTAAPGTIVDLRDGTIGIAAGEGIVRVHQVKPEGRRAMPTRDFLNGAGLTPGQEVTS